MTRDQELVKQLQQRFAAIAALDRSIFDAIKRNKRRWLKNWNPDEQCHIHTKARFKKGGKNVTV